MMPGRLIAISQRVTEHDAYAERRDTLAHDWVRWVETALPGDEMVPLPNAHPDVARWCSRLGPDLLILTGGDDIGVTHDRDETELGALGWFINRRLPVLGICRGAQLVNSFYGGRTTRDATHVGSAHEVVPLDESGDPRDPPLTVNSFHANVIHPADLGRGLQPRGVSPDGSVEAFVHEDDPIIGLQWHPERDHASTEETNRLIAEFVRLAEGSRV